MITKTPVTASIKTVADTRVGDTVTGVARPCDEPLPGYKAVQPMVYSGVYPADGTGPVRPLPGAPPELPEKMGGAAVSGRPAGGRAEGTWGEALAADYLRQRGFRLAAHSYHCRFGEIDLIAWDGDTLCFVEVKTRTNTDMGLPREYVTPAKQRRLRKTALYYLCRSSCAKNDTRSSSSSHPMFWLVRAKTRENT